MSLENNSIDKSSVTGNTDAATRSINKILEL